ncbi:GFA family protein [Dankookia sp. P2]|uniref:GFA family protein n=1 Tax=Dankookia sp. P2 TaxID=3423955 RepID=UPI003D66A3D3
MVTRWVCRDCGTWICNGARPGTAPPGGLVAVRAGTLDDTAWLRPSVHFWTRSAQSWVILPEGDTRFATQPEDGLAWLRSIRQDANPG